MELCVPLAGHRSVALGAENLLRALGNERWVAAVKGVTDQTIPCGNGRVQIVVVGDFLVTPQAAIRSQGKGFFPGLRVALRFAIVLVAVTAIRMPLGEGWLLGRQGRVALAGRALCFFRGVFSNRGWGGGGLGAPRWRVFPCRWRRWGWGSLGVRSGGILTRGWRQVGGITWFFWCLTIGGLCRCLTLGCHFGGGPSRYLCRGSRGLRWYRPSEREEEDGHRCQESWSSRPVTGVFRYGIHRFSPVILPLRRCALFKEIVHVAAMGIVAIDTQHGMTHDFVMHRGCQSFFNMALETDGLQTLAKQGWVAR